MYSNTVNNKLIEFAREYISFSEMKDMVLEWDEPFKIYASKLDGSNIVREMYSVPGPSGNVKYDYERLGYMIFFDEGANDYRTIVLENVEKIVKDNKTYYIR